MNKFIEKYYKNIIIVLATLTIAGFLTAFFTYSPEVDKKKEFKLMNYMEKVEHLKGTYQTFKNMSSKELHVRWLLLFDDAYYKSGGNSNFDRYDCISSLWEFYGSLGGNIVLEDIPNMVRRLRNVSERVTNRKEVMPGDILVFRPVYDRNKNPRWHIAVIEKVRGHMIYYMDMNARVMSRGFDNIYIWDRRVYRIYRMNFSYWVGDLHKRVKL